MVIFNENNIFRQNVITKIKNLIKDMNKQEQLIKKCIEYIKNAHVERIQNLFTPDAQVEGTLYKSNNAVEFFKDFFKDTLGSKTTVNDFTSLSDRIMKVSALHVWTLKEGQDITYNVVGFFHFNKKISKIEKLVITREIVSIS